MPFIICNVSTQSLNVNYLNEFKDRVFDDEFFLLPSIPRQKAVALC